MDELYGKKRANEILTHTITFSILTFSIAMLYIYNILITFYGGINDEIGFFICNVWK